MFSLRFRQHCSLPDATYTVTLPNDVSTVIPALDMSDPSCIIIQVRFTYWFVNLFREGSVCTLQEISGALREWNADVDNAQAQIYDRLLEVNGDTCQHTCCPAMCPWVAR